MAHVETGPEPTAFVSPTRPVTRSRFTLWPTPWRKKISSRLTGHDLPVSLVRLAWRLGSGDQVWLCVLAVLVALLDTVPIDIQRRMINHAIKESGLRSIVLLALTYAGVVLVQGLTKLLSNVYRAWISEHAVRTLRSHITRVMEEEGKAVTVERRGVQVSMIVAECEPVGAFMGECLSEPLLQCGIMVCVVGYLIYLNPVISLILLGVYLPQCIFVPIMQRAINRRAQARIAALREASADVIGHKNGQADDGAQEERFATVFELNIGVYKLKYSMNFLMNFCHQLGIATILGLGGWFVVIGKTQVGTVVAFISGLATVKDPWDDLATWFQTMMVTRARYSLMRHTLYDPDEEGEAENAPPPIET